MKYCTKCKKIDTNDCAESCRFCGRNLISEPNHYSPVHIVTANGFELERIKAALTEAEIPFTVQESRHDAGIQILNSAPMENCDIMVPLSFYTEASDLLIGIGALNEADELSEEDETKMKEARKNTEEELSPRKSFWIKLLSIIVFIAMIGGVILLADLVGRLINPNFS